MRLIAIYIDTFPPFKDCTLNFDSEFDFDISPNSGKNSCEVNVRKLNRQIDIFRNYSGSVTGVIGKSGTGKTSISILLRNLFDERRSVSNIMYLIHETDGKYYFDRVNEKLRTLPVPIDVEIVGDKIDLINLTSTDSDKKKRFDNQNKHLVFHSSSLTGLNDSYYRDKNITNLSLDYSLRSYLKKEKIDELFTDYSKLGGRGNFEMITPFFKEQQSAFFKTILGIKKDLGEEELFKEILEFPNSIDFRINVDSERIKGDRFPKNLNLLSPTMKNFSVHLQSNISTSKDLVKRVKIISLLYLLCNHSTIEKVGKKAIDMIVKELNGVDFKSVDMLFSSVRNVDFYFELMLHSFSVLDELAEKDVFNFSEDALLTPSTEFNDDADKLSKQINLINLLLETEIITYNWMERISAGQRVILQLISDLEKCTDKIKDVNPLFFFDEIDLHLHPEWQRQILHAILIYLRKREVKNFQLIFTTHSPFVLTDIPSYHIKSFDSSGKLLRSNVENNKTFAGNLNDLLVNTMEIESFNGSLSHEIIQDAINYLRNDDSKFIKTESQLKNLLEIIGEPLLRGHLEGMLNRKMKKE